ncbi:HNH endonuclease family protein [Micromonospora sp. LOL_025]|uniref:HNH endonuclease family protein n=1 Tax=Micromonospora sp. LOL_025 TaxID=3345413 RepID=UPI003A89325D
MPCDRRPTGSRAGTSVISPTFGLQNTTGGAGRRSPAGAAGAGATSVSREQVLKRDGTSVVVDSSCAAVSGRWYSPYDGATWSAASDVDIDHVVPLAEAWRSGASGWTTSRRQSFANDLTGPQLIAVTDNVNQAKGDQDPSTWQPPQSAYRCTYSKMWITVKYNWGLALQSSEKSALQSMLNTCSS